MDKSIELLERHTSHLVIADDVNRREGVSISLVDDNNHFLYSTQTERERKRKKQIWDIPRWLIVGKEVKCVTIEWKVTLLERRRGSRKWWHTCTIRGRIEEEEEKMTDHTTIIWNAIFVGRHWKLPRCASFISLVNGVYKDDGTFENGWKRLRRSKYRNVSVCAQS